MAHVRKQNRGAGGGQDQKITHENLDHEPPGNARYRRQGDVDGAQENFVRDRVEVRADARGHAEAPRQGTIEGVGEPPEQNDRQRPPVLLAEDGVNGEWNTRQPDEREQVRDVEPAWHSLTIVIPAESLLHTEYNVILFVKNERLNYETPHPDSRTDSRRRRRAGAAPSTRHSQRRNAGRAT